MQHSEDILEGARCIRSALNDLLDADAARAVDSELAEMLAQANAGQKAETRILSLLAQREPTREWIAEYLAAERAQGGSKDGVRAFRPLPGSQDVMYAPMYRCPENDYVWYRHSLAATVPFCPTHHLQLVRSDEPGNVEENSQSG